MYGRVDRGGSREGNKSLRKNKVFVHTVKTKHEQWLANQNKPPEITVSSPAPPLRPLADAPPGTPALMDVYCNLVSRKLSEDLERVVKRAHQAGLQAIIVQSPDADKQEALLETTEAFLDGQVFCIVGVHPDNTKKTHDTKAIAQRVASLRPLALKPQTVAVSAGMDLTRDISTHFPQEKLLQALLELATSVQLPAVLTASGGSAVADRIIHNVREAALGRFALIHFGGTPADMIRIRTELGDDSASSNDAGPSAAGATTDRDDDEAPTVVHVYYMITGALCDPTELGGAERELAKVVPLHRLLLASDSPHFTPQNISDPWIRQNRNEPSNLPYVLKELTAVTGAASEADLAQQLHINTCEFFWADSSLCGLMEGQSVSATSAEIVPDVLPTVSPTPSRKDKEKQEKEKVNNATVGLAVPLSDRKPMERPRVRHEVPPGRPDAVQPPTSAVQYACKRCRFVLHTASELVPHHRLLRASDDGVTCQTLFFTRPSWLNDRQLGRGQDADDDNHLEDDGDDDHDDGYEEGSTDEGKIVCPKCSLRLGRFRTSGSTPIECSCGAEKDPPAFAYAKKKLDLIVPIEDARAAMVSLRLQEETRAIEPDSDDDAPGKKKRRQKKQKKTNTANFSSFRNKSYGVKTPGKGALKKANDSAETGDAADDAEDDDGDDGDGGQPS